MQNILRTALSPSDPLPLSSVLLPPALSDASLLGEIRLLIEQTHSQVAHAVNSAFVVMNWHIGKRINDEIRGNKRTGYGREILSTLSRKLVAEWRSY